MRLPASEKLEIIGLVEQSHLPARRTLQMLGIAWKLCTTMRADDVTDTLELALGLRLRQRHGRAQTTTAQR